MNQQILAMLLVSLAAAGGGGFLVYDHYRQTADSRPVDGVVVNSGVVTTPDATENLRIRYRYTVGGEQYTGTNVCPAFGDAGCYGDPSDVAAQFPEGSAVTVYVDPDDPSESYLIEDNPPRSGIGLIVFGTGFSALIVFAAARSG